jgi:histidine ammonia-lyase
VITITSSRRYLLEDVEKMVKGEIVSLDKEVLDGLKEARRSYEMEATRRRIYGYCTGLGALQGAKVECDPEVEEITIREHAVGAGPYAPESWSKAFLAVRIIQLSKGFAPIRPEVLSYLVEVLNSGLSPLVPLHGSVGASGDLAPSAFVFRCIFLGEGEAILKNKRIACKEALKSLDLKPPRLATGESLFLINNTSWSSASLALALLEAERALRLSLEVAGSVLELTGFNPEHFDVKLSKAKAHEGQMEVAKIMSKFRPRFKPERLQDPYSFRCIPQVYGAAFDALKFSRGLVEKEINSASENPVVSDGGVYHGCNFHTSYVALASENITWALISVINSIYQRIHHLMSSKLNRSSDFLTKGKSTVGAMILEYLVASLAAEARSLSNPRTVEWLPTSLNQEDSNPMTPNSVLRVFKLLDILAWSVSAELVLGSLIAKRLNEEFKWEINVETTNLTSALSEARDKLFRGILEYQPHTCWGPIGLVSSR